jgi:general secretion pathway protein K
MKRGQRGAALLLVLWVTALLAALLAGVAATARSQSEAALYGSERVRARYAAEAGLAQAIAGLRAPGVASRWVPDGRPYVFPFDGAEVTVRVTDASGLVDLNSADGAVLTHLFEAAGAGAGRAQGLSRAILDWRGGGGPMRAGAATPGGTPRGSVPFRAPEELGRVDGMDHPLYARVFGAITVFSGRNFPDASYAGPLALAAIEGRGLAMATAEVEARRARPAMQGAGNGTSPGMVQGGGLVAGYGGVIERVRSEAVMPDGTRLALDVTLRLALAGNDWRPYKVLGWRVDSAEVP